MWTTRIRTIASRPRQILATLTRAVHELGVPHPLHVHCSNLGVPGNIDSTLATIAAADGLPIHLTHVQFHSYGTEGDRKFSSAARRIADAVNGARNVSIDVGQVVFGQTVTASGDTMAQYRNTGLAQPHKWALMDIECDAGCGVVPFKYRDQNFVNALQWAIGLELFLLVQDPWRVFLTTDHPNGGPFTSYPHLIKLLTDRGFRNEMLASIQPDAAAQSALKDIAREYSLYEIAIMTRAGPARILGLQDRGHLGVGAVADVVIYEPQPGRGSDVPRTALRVQGRPTRSRAWRGQGGLVGQRPHGEAGVRPRHRAPTRRVFFALSDNVDGELQDRRR
jgi:formylmethanofuran dehydrogenase subunit A